MAPHRSYSKRIHMSPGHKVHNLFYQDSFWLILFLGRTVRLAEPGQEAEDSPWRPGERLLLRLPNVLELPLPPGLQPDHYDQHLGLGEQGAPLPWHLLTTDSGVIIYKDRQLVRNMNCGTGHLAFLFLIMWPITHKQSYFQKHLIFSKIFIFLSFSKKFSYQSSLVDVILEQ